MTDSEKRIPIPIPIPILQGEVKVVPAPSPLAYTLDLAREAARFRPAKPTNSDGEDGEEDVEDGEEDVEDDGDGSKSTDEE